VPSRPQLRASTAGPMWRRAAYKLYPPGEHSLSTMLLFTEFLERPHTNPPQDWLKKKFKRDALTHTHTHTVTCMFKIIHSFPYFVNFDSKRDEYGASVIAKAASRPKTSRYADALLSTSSQ